mmetsp:Transcript_25266/g.45467  ORF Transcript_25266/g.45467 Transcript_25266/m.45467 type:complete len:502 (-) Transcript_25266:157-1662(-)|eukprot:CAMPEP_0201919686 /NCGR_PEP_ID=MMETSP0903-20130614/8501_1 /ASSEMBLY_ACC=CAM_ASM_000552 /TAXON_ID=420261 /ORGANISM="Thalassiosira antarctica, Strain CCMP982" /LENGTH=501 /DNA_ID=CAMNT_0048456269 /DNA_START=11 /DNA_END=1516 /DNA_ORIENTATION=+
MVSLSEQHLTETLIDPENLDNPDGEWTKGTKQEAKCRDAWAAILFYAQFIAIAVVAGVLGVPALQKATDSYQDPSTNNIDYDGLIYASLIAGGFSILFSAISLFVMSMCPKVLIQISLLASLVFSAPIVVSSFLYGNIVGGIFGLLFFALSVCYACMVWRRIPFAAANLNTGLTAVKRNAGVVVVAYSIVILSFCYAMLWMTALVGVYDKEGLCDTTSDTTTTETGSTTDTTTDTTTTCSGDLAWGYFFLLLLSLFWTQQVFQNTIHVIIAGVVSTWWFSPEDAGSCCSVAIKDSFVRATTTSFGSICFGSLLVAIIQTLRAMVESVRNNGDNGGGAAFLLCIVDCLLRCLEDALEYFNKYAYIYVGMYGYSYLEAGKNVITLFKEKGWTIIISDNLISNVLSLFCLIIGGLTGCVGLVMNEINPSWFEGYEGAAMGVAFGFSFLIGMVISAITLSVVDSSVNTVLVSFAEAPLEFEENHPELSSAMRDAWRQVYPAECGF